MVDILKQFIALLNLPALVADNIIVFFETTLSVQLPDDLRVWIALCISVFVVILGLVIGFRKTLGRLIACYGGLYVVISLLVIGYSLYVQSNNTQYIVRGALLVTELASLSAPETQTFSWQSNDCDASGGLARNVCSTTSQKITDYKINVSSSNCGAAIAASAKDPINVNCIVVQERHQGCGYKKILGIRECKGRGWLNYTVDILGETTSSKDLMKQNIDANFSSQKSAVIDLPKRVILPNVSVKYVLTIFQDDKDIAVLTHEASSTGNFRVKIEGDKLFVSSGPDAERG